MTQDIHIIEKTLSDGSYVYDVKWGDVVIPCITFDDADDFARGVEKLLTQHTNETCRRIIDGVNYSA